MNALRVAIRQIFAVAPAARAGLAGLVGLSLLVTISYVAQGLLLAFALAELFVGSGLGRAWLSLVGVVALLTVRAWIMTVREARALVVSGIVTDAVRGHLARKLFELGPGALQRSRSGSVQATVVDGVEHLDPLVGKFVPQVFASVLGTVVVGAVVVVLDPLVGLVVLACALTAPLAYVAGAKRMKEPGDRWERAYRDLLAENLDALQGMATLKAFNASGRRGAELFERAERFCVYSIRVMIAFIASVAVAQVAIPAGTATAIGLAAWHRSEDVIGTGVLFAILLLARECFRPLTDLLEAYHASYYALPASKEVFALLARTPDVTSPAAPVPVGGIAAPPPVEFADIRFVYPGRDTPALDGFGLRIAAGQRVAIVGHSGAGKTTVASLLLRWFPLEHGRITIGGVDVADLDLGQLRAMIGVVAQDTYLFHGTVWDNLVLGRPDATVEQVHAAARAARAHEFINALPGGYDTIVGERGLKLSGGERQRIAIARALLKDPPILVLDEPTSAVDAANEAEIQRALDTLTAGRTTLVIAHRLSTVRDADRIVVLDAGRVLEDGAHEQLIDTRGAYARLVAAQIGSRS